MVQKQGDGVMTPTIGLGYIPSQPVKISRWYKDKQSFTQYVMEEETGNDKGDNLLPNTNLNCSSKKKVRLLVHKSINCERQNHKRKKNTTLPLEYKPRTEKSPKKKTKKVVSTK